jgi:nitrogenase molybdenum-iron protein alpha/beta subunit
MSFDEDQAYVLGYQVGVNLALNAIADAWLVVDGPNCVIFRTAQIQGNHDWQADLLRCDGLHRVADTDCTTERAAVGDDRLLVSRLLEVDGLDECRLILLSAMSPAAVTGRQYDKLVADLAPRMQRPVVTVPNGSLSGDWLHGYSRSLESLAAELPLAAPAPAADRGDKVALVGYLWDRNEADHQANLDELRRLLAGLDLELVSCWLDGGPAAGLGRAAEAGHLLALPYGRKAARLLAERTGARVIDCPLPMGLDGSSRWLRAIGQALEREQRAAALIDRELATAVPRLEWVLPHALQGKRLALIADPHLGWAFGGMARELGCKVELRVCWADESHLLEHERQGSERLLVNPGNDELARALQRLCWGEGLDLVVSNSHALRIHAHLGRDAPLPFIELGFPAYYSHALYPSPFLGFGGTLRLVERMINALARARVRSESRGPEGEG